MSNHPIRLTISYFILSCGSIIMLFPFVLMFGSAFKSFKDIFKYPPTMIPEHPTLQSIQQLFIEFHFMGYILNTLFVAVTVTVAALLFHSMAAYSLARLKFPGRDIMFAFIVSTLMIPLYAIIVPRYLIINLFGWVDTYWGLIIPAIPHAFGIFALRQFFLGIPKEIEEAANVDGASKARVYMVVILPLSKGILITLGVLFFMANWDSFIWPLIATTSEEMKLVQVAISGFMDQQNPKWHLVLASAALTSLPSLVIFFTFQRYIVEGIKTAGIKG